jgi:RNA polymerase sigma-70 factor (ECF subfamily)
MGDDLALLQAWRRGDREAGSRLLRRHLGTVYGFFSTKVTPEAAEELTQRTFETCVETRDQIYEGVTVRAYLLGIARNKLLQHHDEWRRRGSRAVAAGESLPGHGPTASSIVAQGDQQRLVLRALAKLPLDFQCAVELFYWESLSVQEIAHVLEIAEGTVKSRLARARGLLKQAIGELDAEPSLVESTIRDLDEWIASMRRHATGAGDAE